MRSNVLVPALAAIAAALPAPNPQQINLDLVLNAPRPTFTQATGVTAQVVTYDTSAILASATAASSISVALTNVASSSPSVVKRAVCSPQPSGYGPVTTSPRDDAASFLANPVYANAALSAAVPSGYVQTFRNLTASSSAYGYLGFTNLKAYDTQACATKCNAIKGCMGINIYFERDPKLTPDATSCPNPPSLTQIKCVFWGGPVTTSNTNNPGRTWASFSVVVAGSNGYVNQNIAAPSGYTDALYLGNAAINAPYDSQGFDTFMGSKVFTLGPFNASLCAEACGAQNVYNLANPPTDGSPVQTCQFFNTYLLYLNDTVGLGQYCAMYSETWTSKYATKVEQWRGSDRYTVQYSYAFSNVTVPGVANKNAAVYQASKDISASTLQPFCSTFLGYNDLNAYATKTTTKVPVVTVTATTTIKTKAKRSVVSSSASSSGLKTPDALTKYPGSVVSSACQMLVTSVQKTATITVATVTVSGATSKTTTTKTVITTTR